MAIPQRGSRARPLQTKIKSLSDTTTNLIRLVKNLNVALRPGPLDELGLVKTLKSMTTEFAGFTGIQCAFRTNVASAIFDRPAAIAVFRIVQAALTNVARHARASSVTVNLRKGQHDLIFTVKDDGRGISRKRVDSETSLGIIGMRERTVGLEGTFTLAGSRGAGTTLTVRIPLSRAIIGTAAVR